MAKRNPQIEKLLDMMKEETASEMGIQLGADTTSRANGSVGGTMTKKLIRLGELKLMEMVAEQGLGNVELSQYLEQQDGNNNRIH